MLRPLNCRRWLAICYVRRSFVPKIRLILMSFRIICALFFLKLKKMLPQMQFPFKLFSLFKPSFLLHLKTFFNAIKQSATYMCEQQTNFVLERTYLQRLLAPTIENLRLYATSTLASRSHLTEKYHVIEI